MSISSLPRATDVQRARYLEWATIGWNIIEALVAMSAGWSSGSIALISFAFDSVIESLSGTALLWRLHQDDEHRRERAEHIALKLVGLSFLLLAIYVAWDAAKSLLHQESPTASPAGMILAALSLVVMPLLARAKRAVANRIESNALHADARQTDICFYLSIILLAGLGLNWLNGLWWADPVAAFCMIPIILKEAFAALRGESCTCGS